MVTKSIVFSYRKFKFGLLLKENLLKAFKPHLKIFEFKIVKVETSLTIAGSTRYGNLGSLLLLCEPWLLLLSMQVIMNKCFLLNHKKIGADLSCRFRENKATLIIS